MTNVQQKILKYNKIKHKPWIIAKLTSVRTGYIKEIFRKYGN